MPVAGHPFGLHRVLDPPGALPQNARKLDADSPPRSNEIGIHVSALSVDSASFLQMREVEASGGAPVSEQIVRIVSERGKLQNPVTGSGGMLIGEVTEVGKDHPAHGTLAPGERIASLVSLTLTPLAIRRVVAVHRESDRVDVDASAVLFARTLFARLPSDISEPVALAAFDVAGAPASVRLHARPGATVLVIGTGKAGLLALEAARERIGPAGRLLAVEPEAASAARARALGVADHVFSIDARDAVAVFSEIEKETRGGLADLVINAVNAPATEAASILCARDDGTVLFFGMATSFSAAALLAEGLAKPTTLLIGNGYTPGHAEYALDLLRRHGALRRAFEELAGTR
jgi:L-erythro-3,5-diaminohexanoate dehydrogenase